MPKNSAAVKHLLSGLVTGFLLLGCAGAVFPYKYYALDAQSYEGFLRGPDPKDDVKLSDCTPTAADKAPCIVMKSADFIRAKTDYKDMQNRLQKCEQPRTGD